MRNLTGRKIEEKKGPMDGRIPPGVDFISVVPVPASELTSQDHRTGWMVTVPDRTFPPESRTTV